MRKPFRERIVVKLVNQCEDRLTNNSLKTDKNVPAILYSFPLYIHFLYLLHTYVGITGTHFVGSVTE